MPTLRARAIGRPFRAGGKRADGIFTATTWEISLSPWAVWFDEAWKPLAMLALIYPFAAIDTAILFPGSRARSTNTKPRGSLRGVGEVSGRYPQAFCSRSVEDMERK